MNGAMGDRADRFTALYESAYGAIHAYAARRVGELGADEIAAETFLVAWRRWDVVPAEPLPWLYGVARHVLARHCAASSRRRITEAAIAHERATTPPGPNESGDPALWDAWES